MEFNLYREAIKLGLRAKGITDVQCTVIGECTHCGQVAEIRHAKLGILGKQGGGPFSMEYDIESELQSFLNGPSSGNRSAPGPTG